MSQRIRWLVLGEGRFELEQMGAADPPLGVDRVRRDRHRLRSCLGVAGRCDAAAVDNLLAVGRARLAPVHGPVFIRAAVCREVAQRETDRLNVQLRQSFSVQSEQTSPRFLRLRLVVNARVWRTPTVRRARIHFDFRRQTCLRERLFQHVLLFR
jgi:hypothetical protein